MVENKTAVETYFARQRSLLQFEYEQEKTEFKRQSEQSGIARLVDRGQCWFPLRTGKSYYNAMNQFVAEILRADGSEAEHAFEYGRPVCFFYEGTDGRLRYLDYVATVSYADMTRMVVVFPSADTFHHLEALTRTGVQLSFDETSYRAMFGALDAVSRARENRLAELRDILCGQVRPSFRSLFPMRFPWLNASQESAVNKMLCSRDVMVVHGPPGTGKTTTLTEAIYETLHREPQVLVCAQSNMAVDWISEQLVDRGVPVLRIGNPTRVNDKMLSFTYERRFADHPSYPELWGIRRSIRDLTGSLRGRRREERDTLHNRLRKLRGRAVELEVRIHADLFDNAKVIASTLVGSDHRVLSGRHFGTLFVDEAGQALEAACWIAIRKADRVVFAGDHCQLPPTVKSREALAGGLGCTLMERVAKHWPEAVSLLTVQYRMNRAIMQFSSDWFYHGMLKAAPSVEHRGILDFDVPVTWIDTSDTENGESYVAATGGRENPEEALRLVEALERYVGRIGTGRIIEENIDFGLISPYRAQVRIIRRLIHKSASLRPLARLVTVNTVDGFQGQERDVIFISLVRDNERGQIGFLRDLRRMNVAMTRARMKLVILGSAATLSRHPFYHRLWEYAESLKPDDRGAEK